jgi:hypothetical protein
MIDFFGNPWVQMILWVFAASMTFYFDRFMKGANIAWTFIAIGVLLIGIRMGYKLVPFYQDTKFIRYVISITGFSCLFIGLLSYCNTTLKSFRGNH